MRYVVYGAGAVGGVIGGHLHLADRETSLVARGEHLTRIRAGGLRLDTGTGMHVIEAPATDTAAGIDWSADTVCLLTVKSHQVAAALDDLAAHAPASTVVVCATNGVASENAVLRRFARTYALCVMLPSTHLEPGVVVAKCHPVPGLLDLGRVPSGTDEACEAVAADLRTAGFESVPRPDIMAWKHRKLLMNVGNGVDAACAEGKAADELARLATEEGEQAIAAAGIPLVSAEEDRARRADLLRTRTDSPVPRGGSTWQSMRRGSGSTEVDYLAGEIVLLGRLYGVPTPACEVIQRVTSDLARRGGPARSLDADQLLASLPDR
ncbi:MAG: ketopantoate reductase family protein [Nocardioides sp.]